MIRNIVKSFICVVKDHSLIEVGKCPFTGNNYKMCIRCQKMVTA